MLHCLLRILLHFTMVIALVMTVVPVVNSRASMDEKEAQTLLDGLKDKIIKQDPRAATDIDALDAYFAASPNTFLEAQHANIRAYAEILNQDYVSAYELLLLARQNAEQSKNQHALAESFRLEGMILDLAGEYAGALELLNRSLDIFTALDAKENVLDVFSAIGNVYISLRDYPGLLALSERYLSYAQLLANDQGIGTAYFLKGTAEVEMGEYQDAKVSLLLAEKILAEIQFPFIGIVYGQIANLHIKTENIEEALKRISQSSMADAKVGFLYIEGSRVLQLSEIYRLQGNPELAVTELQQGLQSDAIQNDKLLVMQILEELIDLHEQLGKYEDAMSYTRQYKQVYEQSFNEQQSRSLALNKVRLAVNEKEEEIRLLQKDNELKEQRNELQKKANTQQLYLIAFALLSLVLVSFLLMRTRAQRRALDSYAQQLQKATEAKSDFLARMSHEIRTPMNAIVGLTRLSLKTAENPEQQVNLKQIEGASQTLMGVLNDILDFSKIEAGKLDIESTLFDLDKLVSQSIRYQSIKAKEKNIELIQHIGRDVPPHVKGDPMRIQQVLSNLLSNAVKFTDEGLVSVIVKRRHSVNQHVLLEFEVKDTGIGLSSEDIDRIFQPFHQADESTSRKYGGTGLGLAICQQLATMMGGEIWAEGTPGKGASFFFTVLIETGEAPAPTNISSQVAALKVLVADDIDLSRQAVADALLLADIHVDMASGGQQAIDMLRSATKQQAPYDILILDWKMPDVDGLDVAAVIAQDPKMRRPKIIMLSAFDSLAIREQAKALGVLHFVEKPFSASDLINAIQELTVAITVNKPAFADTPRGLDLSDKRILVAEDNALNQKVALGLLKETHAQVDIVGNGIQVIERLSAPHCYDLVLMDIQMPDMDGLTACRKIRDELKQEIPIIAMTAHAMQRDIEKCREAGMNAHITKPIHAERFYEVLEEILRSDNGYGNGQKRSHFTTKEKGHVGPDDVGFINKTKAISELLNDESLYHMLLNDFIALEPELTELEKAIKENNYAVIFRIAHIYSTALKYIGAYNLAVQSDFIDNAIRTETHGTYADFQQRLTAFLDALITMTRQAQVALQEYRR